MKVQSIEKLPRVKELAAAVRLGSNGQQGIAAVNHAELAAKDQPPHSYLRSANDPKYGGSGPPPTNLEMIRYQSWLRANSVVPDGMACWMKDPKPHPKYGARWVDWSGARVEYMRRSRNSEKQSGHIKPNDELYSRTRVRTDAEVYTHEFLARLHAWRMRNLYVRNVYLPDTGSTKAEDRPCPPVTEPEVQQVQHTVAANDVTSARDRVHRSEMEAVQVQWHRYQHHLERMQKVSNQGESNAPWVFGMMGLHPLGDSEKYNLHRRILVNVREERKGRYEELCQKLYDLEERKRQVDREAEQEQASTVPAEEKRSSSWWAKHMPAMGYLKETPPKVQESPVPEVSAANETVMSPAEEQTSQREGPLGEYSHSEEEYQLYLNAMEEGRISPKIHNIWLVMAHKLRLGGHRPYLRGRTELTSLYLKTIGAASTVPITGLKVGAMADSVKEDAPQNPSKLLGKYTPSVSEALVYDGTIDRNLRMKQQEIEEYVRSIGGLGSFYPAAQGILVPQVKEIEEDLPWD